MKCVAARCRRRWFALPNHPGHGSAMPLNSHAGYGFARTLGRLLHLLKGLLSFFPFCISGTDVIGGDLSACPVSRLTVTKPVGKAKGRQNRYIGSCHAVTH